MCDTDVEFDSEKRVDKISATFDFAYFHDVEAVLLKKYGPATEKRTEQYSDQGLALSRQIEVWRDRDGSEMTLVDFAGPRTGMLTLETKARAELDRQRSKKS